MKKHIEITWSNGEKTVEVYSPDICTNSPTTAEQVFTAFRELFYWREVKPVSYRELD